MTQLRPQEHIIVNLQLMADKRIVDDIVSDIVYNGKTWAIVGAAVLTIPLGIGILKSKSPGDVIDSITSYPSGVLDFGFYGSIFGFASGMHKHNDVVAPAFGDYTVAVITNIRDHLYTHSVNWLSSISGK